MTNADQPPPPGPGARPVLPPTGSETAARPFYQRWWFVALVAVAVLSILGGNGGDGDDSETASNAAPSNEAPSTTPPPASAPEPEPAPAPSPEPDEPATEEPQPEPEPEPEPEPSFEPVVIEGRGDDIIDVPVVTDIPVVATFEHRGSSNFAVVSFDEDVQRIDLLVNEIGNYTGTVPLNFARPAAELEISADGPWTVTISDLRDQPIYDGSATGRGDQVLLVIAPSGRVDVTHSGESNFVVRAWGNRRTLMVNEIGNYSGTVRLPDAIALEVKADGTWTLDQG